MIAVSDQQPSAGASTSSERPKVLIVGAGIAGVTLGMLLTKAGVTYNIYERAQEVKNLGSAIFLNPTTTKLFKQTGIWDEMMAIAKLTLSIQMANEKREVEYRMDFTEQHELFGSNGYIVPRPFVYDLLMRQVPEERFHRGKKVASTEQTDKGVVVTFTDGTVAEGDILVGADGAYSTVRQQMYEELEKKGQLPPEDALPLPFSTVCLVGQTRPLAVEEFPIMKEERCQFINVLGDNKPYSWTYFTTKQNTVCWMIVQYLEEEATKEKGASNIEWGPGAAETMRNQVREFPIISGSDKPLTLGHLLDWTPIDLISRALLEEKVFHTWHHNRTVLIGDACHKLNVAGGTGATNAIHDAIGIANWINVLSSNSSAKEISDAFTAYQKERMPWIKSAFESSTIFRIMAEKSFKAKVVRFISKHMPAWLTRKMMIQMTSYQPQSAFLPLIPDLGIIKSVHQESLHDTLSIIEQRRKAKEALDTNAI
ncbi:hypothetical protein BGX29_006229 [Mortierella sp. GBA35]|nr:hypothetical protein BGX29_006229 [Mortierella sp. GBA35]